MEKIEYILRIIENLELFSIFTVFLVIVLILIIVYMVHMHDNQRKENAIKREILRKKIGCSAEDFYHDVS